MPTEYALKKAAEHIWYEAWMMYVSAIGVTRAKTTEDSNICLDAFAIHVRNLFNFLYPNTRHPKRDDIWVTDYIERRRDFDRSKTKKRDLKFILKKADKQVSHLTYARNRYGDSTKGWLVKDVVQKLHQSLVAFYGALPSDRKSWEYFKALDTLLMQMNSII